MPDSTHSKQGQALSVRLWMGCLATQEMLCNYLGIRLGLYRALAEGPATADQLSRRAGIDPRYAREWLEQQAVSGIVRVVVGSGGADRAFFLPDAHREVVTDCDSPLSRVAGILPLGAVAGALPRLLAAYRSGAGLTDSEYGEDWRWGHGASNRAVYTHSLPRWIHSGMPDVHARLSVIGSRVADVACGAGWAAIAIARAYPHTRVDGFENDPDLVEDATGHARDAGVGDRVSFHVYDCNRPAPMAPFDLVCLFDTLHELPRPVDVLRTCGAFCGPAGSVLVMDAKVADRFEAPGNEIERFQYTTSVLHCLPACLADPPSAGTGTVMRAPQVRRFAEEAGFSSVEILPIDERFHRFYRLLL